MSVLWELFSSFFTIGCFSFGGGFAVLSFLQQEVERQGWMTTERFIDFVAIAQSTPGPIAINMATFVGFEIGGVAGALLASIAVALPGMILMTIFALCLFHFYERAGVQAFFRGLRPAVVGLVAAAAWQIGRVVVVDWRGILIALVCLGVLIRWKVGPIWLVLGSAVAGVVLF